MSEARNYCQPAFMSDNLNQSLSRVHFSDYFGTINTITYNITFSLVQLAIFIYVISPVLFRYSLYFRRHILFAHSVGFNIYFRKNFFKPETHGIQGGRNFYLTSEKIKLGVWHILPKSESKTAKHQQSKYWDESLKKSGKPVIVYFHGSIGTRATGNRVELYKLLQGEDYHVIAFDYRGFGDSTPVLPSETRAVADGLLVFNWLRGVLGNESNIPIFFWGHSMGTGVSSHLTSRLNRTESESEERGNLSPLGIILEAPFTNMKDEVRVYFISYIYNFLPLFEWFFVDPMDRTDMKFDVEQYILDIKVPTLILHSINDPIVPYWLGKKLYNKARSKLGQRIHLSTFSGFNFLISHSYICRSPRLPGILKNFRKFCKRAIC